MVRTRPVIAQTVTFTQSYAAKVQITRSVIYDLGGGRTYTHTCMHIRMKLISKNQEQVWFKMNDMWLFYFLCYHINITLVVRYNYKENNMANIVTHFQCFHAFTHTQIVH